MSYQPVTGTADKTGRRPHTLPLCLATILVRFLSESRIRQGDNFVCGRTASQGYISISSVYTLVRILQKNDLISCAPSFDRCLCTTASRLSLLATLETKYDEAF